MGLPQTFIGWIALVNIGCLSGALFCSAFLILKGPGLPTRIVALGVSAIVFAGLAISYAIITSRQTYIDVAVAVCLIEFLSTLAFARYIQGKKQRKEKVSTHAE